MDWARMIPSVSYGAEKVHRWGPVTATINWCEEDYVVTSYCAEIINSITNAMFIYLAVRGIRNCLKEGHDKVFLLTWMSLMVVGIGSFLFHSTLWYSMQLVDELSMISTTLIMWFATFAYGKSNAFSWVFGCGLFSSFILMASVYHHLGDPVFHQNGYAILTSIVLGRSWFLVRSHLKGKSPEDYYIMKCLFFTGLGCVATAFALWSADTQYCGTIRGWRREIGMPWGFFLEGHGHWHLLTGLGGYIFIVYGLYLRHCINKNQDQVELIWPSMFSLPEVSRRKLPKSTANGKMSNGTVNGSIKQKKEL